ncbi:MULTISPECIES: RNA helicase [unclassified Adlercreutzia]|uniref:DEAD/DEAH box helicase n=1 Tax=unclassified Adlercreutzia TaxID=2636013 RepID=UPI0013ECFAEC|nr:MULTISPECIES: DEAD/DEAH box helicase [unclassified Adlercreutzia]
MTHPEITDPFAPGSLSALAPSWWLPEDTLEEDAATDSPAGAVDGPADASALADPGAPAPASPSGAPTPTPAPDLDETDPWLTPDEALERFLDWVDARGIEPWPHQEDALMNLAVGDHVILGTPTGSGKSLVAQGLCFMAMATGRRAYYTAPIKALVSEKFFDMVDVLGRDNVGMITGDSTINTEAPVICCTAEILANQALREGEGADVGCVVMDEFHYYGDVDRGWAWQVPLLTLPRAQFLLMSATLGDTSAIAAALEERTGKPVDTVADAPRPVPLAFEYSLTPLEGTVELALRKGEAPLYLVHFSQDAAIATAQSLASYGVATKEQREAVKAAVKGTAFTTAFGKILKRLLECGVGVHHAGMLPRYRLLVEKLAQQGLLPVICGTDTLGVGINVPIHTVVLTQLTKFDGHKMRRLRAREFHQIAGRAGRAGFDTEGMVIAEAPEHEIENAKLVAKAGDDPKKLRKIKKKKPPEGFVAWNEATFTRLIDAVPETLTPRMRITHSMVLAVISRGGDARARVRELIAASAQTDEQKAKLHVRADEIFATLIEAGVVERTVGDDGSEGYVTTVEMPEDFALDQPLSPFMLAALDLFDPQSDTYALDVISLVEATLEDPRQVLRAQERVERDRAMAEMKADGVEYEERLERLAEVTYPRPLEDVLNAAFGHYCRAVPWARDFELAPKSVLRDMIETASDFKTYVNRYGIARSEGTLLRYLSDAYRVLDRTLPQSARDDVLRDVISWLGLIVRSTDSSLVDEWENAGSAIDVAAPAPADEVVRDRRGLAVLVRNALFARVRLAAADKAAELGRLDAEWGFGERRWSDALDAYYEAHDEVLTDADARSAAFLVIDEADEKAAHVWHVHQTFSDEAGDRDFGIMADVDLDATQEQGEVVFKNYRAGFIEDLLER